MRRSPRPSILVFAAVMMAAAQPSAVPAQSARQRELGESISACIDKPSVDCAREMLRLGLRARNLDPTVCREAVEALRGMSGEEAIGKFLLREFDREWQRGDIEMVKALALTLLPVEGSDVARGIQTGLDRRMATSPQVAAVVTGIVAMAARSTPRCRSHPPDPQP